MAVKKGMEYTGVVERTDFPNRGIVYVEDDKVIVKNGLPGRRYVLPSAKSVTAELKVI